MATKRASKTTTGSDSKSSGLQGFLTQASEYSENSQTLFEAFPDLEDVLSDPKSRRDSLEKESTAAYSERREAAKNFTLQRSALLNPTSIQRPYWEINEDGDKNSSPILISGRIVDSQDGQGLPGISLRAVDLDRKRDDVVGIATSDIDGNFAFRFSTSDFSDPDKISEVFIEALDGKGKMVTRTSKSFSDKTPSGTAFIISVPVEKFPGALAAKEKVLIGKAEDFSRLQRSARSQGLALTQSNNGIPVGILKLGLIESGPKDNPTGAAPKTKTTQPDTTVNPATNVANNNLLSIPGVDAQAAKALAKNKIATTADLAKTKPSDIAKTLNISAAKAKEMVKEAEKRTIVK